MTATRRFSPRARLAAVRLKLRQLDVFGPVRQTVTIAQETVQHPPAPKWSDAFGTRLAGAHGLVAINTRLRSDPALQLACGRAACAEQAVVQETLDACTPENVAQVAQALETSYRQHSRGSRHDDGRSWQIVDAAMRGLPGGPTAAFATKGYFAKRRTRRGRQLGRVVASRSEEIVVDRLFPGQTPLTTALQPLVLAAGRTLELDAPQRARTIPRVDAGGGSLAEVHWAWQRGYQGHGKDSSTSRATK